MNERRTTPWRAEFLPESSRVFNRHGYLLATCVGRSHQRHAKLFSAAPDLYSICRIVAREKPTCNCGACPPCVARWVIKSIEE